MDDRSFKILFNIIYLIGPYYNRFRKDPIPGFGLPQARFRPESSPEGLETAPAQDPWPLIGMGADLEPDLGLGNSGVESERIPGARSAGFGPGA